MSDLSALLEQFPIELRDRTALALKASPYIQRQLSKYPQWIERLITSQAYQQDELSQHVHQVIAACDNEADLMRVIRETRHFETVRIAWRDLTRLGNLRETLADITALADSLVNSVLLWRYDELAKRHGIPRNADGEAQQMVVLGMGKLGGRELNFSSDIDLIFAFPEAGETDGRKSIDNQTFFTKVGQKLINSLGQTNAYGFAYRVDMRLRPFGDSGALVLSFDAMEYYYQTHGREWERYAMVKARVIAGDQARGAELMQSLKPFIYRRYMDYGAIEQLRDMKQRINREALRRGKVRDVKLGTGGIREVEFILQVFQLMRGGRQPELQTRHLLKTLACVAELELVTQQEAELLQQAYCFYRDAENRLQMWGDEQTHALPEDEAQQAILAESMGFSDWQSFMVVFDDYRGRVHDMFRKIFALEGEEEDNADDKSIFEKLWQAYLDDEQSVTTLEELGFQQPEQSWELIHNLGSSRLYASLTETARNRMDRLVPRLIEVCSQQKRPGDALERSLRIVQAVAKRSVYISMLAEHPEALEHLVKLVHGSTWITTLLTKHPILFDELLDTRRLYTPLNRDELRTALNNELNKIDSDDTDEVMERLRQFKNAQMFRVAAADIANVLPLMKVSDQLTWIAEAILASDWRHVWHVMQQRSGVPCYNAQGESKEAGFAIIGYGKLGGIELGYGSDLDIIFLHNSPANSYTNGKKQLDNQVFYTRLSQRIIHTLSTYTHDGRLYETDTRLRPSGASGLLVTSVDSFKDYQLNEAWIWEHQALLRARAITGTTDLQEQFEQVRKDILCQPREPKKLKIEVVEMREKMWESLGSKDPQLFNMKKDPGGITDIEFLVQYLILLNAHKTPELVKWSDNIRQMESLQETDLLTTEEAETLSDIYRTLRKRIHKVTLQERPAVVPITEYQREREYVQACWGKYLG